MNSASLIATCVIALFVGCQVDAVPTDGCAILVPQSVRAAITRQYPNFRLPRQSDYDAGDIKNSLENGGTACLGIAKGSYHDTQKTDYAINIASAKKPRTILIVATQVGKSWQLDLVRDWGDADIGGIYVDTEEPGTYERTEALEGPVSEPGELEKYTASLQGIVAGAIESSGVVFFFDGKGWVHVWVSD